MKYKVGDKVRFIGFGKKGKSGDENYILNKCYVISEIKNGYYKIILLNNNDDGAEIYLYEDEVKSASDTLNEFEMLDNIQRNVMYD